MSAALERALGAAEAALAAGDALAAAAAVGEAVAACAALEARTARLDPEALERLRALHARGAAAAAARRDALAAALGLAGRSRQAEAAYRRAGPG